MSNILNLIPSFHKGCSKNNNRLTPTTKTDPNFDKLACFQLVLSWSTYVSNLANSLIVQKQLPNLGEIHMLTPWLHELRLCNYSGRFSFSPTSVLGFVVSPCSQLVLYVLEQAHVSQTGSCSQTLMDHALSEKINLTPFNHSPPGFLLFSPLS